MKAWMLAIALAACGGSSGTGATAPSGGSAAAPVITEAAERDQCTTDEDCALVDACCGCNAGGRKVGIRVDAVAAYDQSRPQRCGDQMCAQHISNHPSCNAEPVCKNGHCRAQPHMNQGDSAPVPPAGPM